VLFVCRKSISIFVSLLLVAVFALPLSSLAHEKDGKIKGSLSFEGSHSPIWHLKAKKPFLIGGYGDNFNYDGSRVTPLLGKAKVILDSVKDAGTMVVNVKGTINPEKGKTYTGDIKMYYTVTGGGPAFHEGGVADFIYMHGDTKQGPPVMPKVRTYLASWGSADVYVNDALVYKGLDGHMMYTERSRDISSKAIYNKDRSGFYSHKDPADFSIAAPHESELHFVAHSMEKDTGNFPPNTVWIHLNFEQVKDKSYGQRGFSRRGKRGGYMRGGQHPCGVDPAIGKCGPGCGCGCQAGGPCSCGAGGAAITPCGPGCGCGCQAGGPCSCGTDAAITGKCGAGCGCGCNAGGPCAMIGGTCGAGCGCGCNAGAPCKMN
jgi:hypothetical protein